MPTNYVQVPRESALRLGLKNADILSLRMTTPVGMAVPATINGVRIQGDLTAEDLGLARASIHTTEEWGLTPTYVPAKGELVIYTDAVTVDGNTYPALKIGDGNAYVVDLPFSGGPEQTDILNDLIDQLNEHIRNTAIHVSTEDRERWDNKLNYEVSEATETLVLNRT